MAESSCHYCTKRAQVIWRREVYRHVCWPCFYGLMDTWKSMRHRRMGAPLALTIEQVFRLRQQHKQWKRDGLRVQMLMRVQARNLGVSYATLSKATYGYGAYGR